MSELATVNRKKGSVYMVIRRMLLVAPLLALCSVGAPPARAQDGAKIVTANTIRIFNEMQETKDLTVTLKQQGNNLQAEDVRRRADLENLKSTRDRYKPDTQQYNDENQKLLKGSIDYQVWG